MHSPPEKSETSLTFERGFLKCQNTTIGTIICRIGHDFVLLYLPRVILDVWELFFALKSSRGCIFFVTSYFSRLAPSSHTPTPMCLTYDTGSPRVEGKRHTLLVNRYAIRYFPLYHDRGISKLTHRTLYIAIS